MERRLRLKRSLPQAGLELGTARSVGQCLTHGAPTYDIGIYVYGTYQSVYSFIFQGGYFLLFSVCSSGGAPVFQ